MWKKECFSSETGWGGSSDRCLVPSRGVPYPISISRDNFPIVIKTLELITPLTRDHPPSSILVALRCQKTTCRWSFLFLLKFPGWLSLVVEIEYSKDEEQGLSFLKSFDDQVGKFDLCVRRLPPSIWHNLFSRVPAAKMTNRKRWGSGGRKTCPRASFK